MYLSINEIEPSLPRDSQAQAVDMAQKMQRKYQWTGEDPEDKRISAVIADAEDELEAWSSYLERSLKFPFKAKVNEYQEQGQLNEGDKVQVQKITEADDLYGILVDVQCGRRRFVFPLCDLVVRDKKSANYIPVQDYCVWFANK